MKLKVSPELQRKFDTDIVIKRWQTKIEQSTKRKAAKVADCVNKVKQCRMTLAALRTEHNRAAGKMAGAYVKWYEAQRLLTKAYAESTTSDQRVMSLHILCRKLLLRHCEKLKAEHRARCRRRSKRYHDGIKARRAKHKQLRADREAERAKAMAEAEAERERKARELRTERGIPVDTGLAGLGSFQDLTSPTQ